MNKEDILKKSREENQNGDEREHHVVGIASRVGISIAGLLCVILMLVSELLFDSSILALSGCFVSLGMYAGQKFTLYRYTKKKSDLTVGAIDSIGAIIALVLLVTKV